MESNLIEIELLDLLNNGYFSPYIYARVSDGKVESKDFFMKVDTGSDITIIPASFVKNLHFALYNDPIIVQWGIGGITEHITPWTGFVKFSNGISFRTDLVIEEESDKAFLGMDILSQGSLFLTSKGGYFLIQ